MNLPTIKCKTCNVDINSDGKCPKCGNQAITVSGGAKIILSDDGSVTITG